MIKQISNITQQKNLLDLNATIEAARATEGVSAQINKIHGLAASVTSAILEIREIINQIIIAGAEGEQSANTSLIFLITSVEAENLAGISNNLSLTSNAAQTSEESAVENSVAAAALTQVAAQLNETVSRFRLDPDAFKKLAASTLVAKSALKKPTKEKRSKSAASNQKQVPAIEAGALA